MSDETDNPRTVDGLLREILQFRDERDWAQFHTPRDLATGVSIEAAELLELFLWKSRDQTEADLADPDFRLQLAHEIADVTIYSMLLAHTAGLDLPAIIREKLAHNAKKYPVSLCRGRATKARDLKNEPTTKPA
jgi:NTP pyrophosphatase (non-canonical NTP hydrolase)